MGLSNRTVVLTITFILGVTAVGSLTYFRKRGIDVLGHAGGDLPPLVSEDDAFLDIVLNGRSPALLLNDQFAAFPTATPTTVPTFTATRKQDPSVTSTPKGGLTLPPTTTPSLTPSRKPTLGIKTIAMPTKVTTPAKSTPTVVPTPHLTKIEMPLPQPTNDDTTASPLPSPTSHENFVSANPTANISPIEPPSAVPTNLVEGSPTKGSRATPTPPVKKTPIKKKPSRKKKSKKEIKK